MLMGRLPFGSLRLASSAFLVGGGTALDAEGWRRTAKSAEDCFDLGVMDRQGINVITGQIVDSAMRVHSALGPGLLESAYDACLAHELRKRGLRVQTQFAIPVVYDGVRMDVGYRVDQLVEECVLVELKANPKLPSVLEPQVLSYLKLGDYRVALLINFHVQHLRDGIKRYVNKF